MSMTITSVDTLQSGLRVCQANYADASHARALSHLLNLYAQDVMGGGHALSQFALDNLAPELARRPQAFSVLAFVQGEAAGLVNCMEGFSTFACKPLVNVHDLAVHPKFRRLGIARQMMGLAERIALSRGACKLTLEVLQGNASAIQLYREIGFLNYQLDPAMGQAMFLQKLLE